MTASVIVRLTPRQAARLTDYLLSQGSGHGIPDRDERCSVDHPHAGLCDGWTPADCRSIETAIERLYRAQIARGPIA